MYFNQHYFVDVKRINFTYSSYVNPCSTLVTVLHFAILLLSTRVLKPSSTFTHRPSSLFILSRWTAQFSFLPKLFNSSF